MAMVETASAFPDSSMEQDDVVYPCKGCGEILEEGKAFELAGNRWHIDCFRCNTCGTLLDSDANLLLLGDGSLICNNCTYSCSACNNKIEDLAILTGDQAFCANCFRCRNCKRKIDNLRYARTSQGIFCMSCHESLMARRRKNKKANRNPAPNTNGLNKSLPDLPRPPDMPSSAFSSTPDMETPPSEQQYSDLSDKYADTPSDVSPRPRQSKSRNDASSERVPTLQREISSPSLEDHRKDDLTLPASTFKGNRVSTLSKNSGLSYGTANGDDFFGTVPLLLDTNNNVEASPAANGRDYGDTAGAHGNVKAVESKGSTRDYFGRAQPSSSSARDVLREAHQQSSRSSSMDRKQPQSPHIAYQQKGRQPSDHITDPMRRQKDGSAHPSSPAVARANELAATPSQTASPSTQNDFRLQEAPKFKKSGGSRRSSKGESRPPMVGSQSTDVSSRNTTPRVEIPLTSSPPQIDDRASFASDDYGSPNLSQIKPNQEPMQVERPKRGDSLAASSLKSSLARKEVGSSPQASHPTTPTGPPDFIHERKPSSSSSRQMTADGNQQLNGGRTISKPIESPTSKSIMDVPNIPPPKASSRPAVGGVTETFTAPRAPPPAPPAERHKTSASTSTIQSDLSNQVSPTNLPRHSSGADFSMEEEMERIMRGEDKHEPGMLRKVSNAVKHGRSFSDRGARATPSSQKWAKSPLNGNLDISSPTSATSPDAREENILLKNRLRQAQERIAKLEVEKNGLQTIVNGSADISQVNTELKEKRSTMAFLDTQREIVVRELEVMTEHLKKAKETNKPLDMNDLKSNVSRDFAASLQKLKDTLGSQIEELMQRRNELTREIDDLIQMKDKGFQEYESLSSRNHQLTQHNNELIANIQGSMKAVAHQNNGSFDSKPPIPNGLGLYIQNNKDKSETSNDLRTILSATEYSNTNLMQDNDSESTVVATPQVVKIGKGKPNMLKKGTQGFVKGLRNMRGNLVAERGDRSIERSNTQYPIEGTPYNQLPAQSDASGNLMSKQMHDPGRQKFGFFNSDKAEKSHLKHLKTANNNSNPSLASDSTVTATQLFGTDLGSRCDFEKRVIPCIVSRCIEEVELRGMDVEGVYRKSGGTGQVNSVRIGFEKDNDYDISDPDLDIHAVTSALKQYFRKLPTPLITFDVYDQLLEASKLEEKEHRALAMKEAVNELPKSHKDCLEFLVFHLAKVMAHEKDNLMTPLNLAVVFAPTIMRPQTIEREMSDMQAQRVAVQSLLEMNQVIFGYDS